MNDSIDPDDDLGSLTGQKILAAVVTVVGLTLIGLIIWGVVALGNSISPPVIHSSTSPGGTWVIEVRKTALGDSGASGLLVTVRKKDEKGGQEVVRLDPESDAPIQWEKEGRLRIEWESDAVVRVGGIRVTLPPPPGQGC